MLVHVAHPGTQRGFRVAQILQKEGRLATFSTTLAFNEESTMARRFPARSLGAIPSEKLRRIASWYEWVNVIGARLPGYDAWKDRCWLRRNRVFGSQVGAITGSAGDILYGFDTASAEMFRAAKARGLRCVLDQTIVHSVRAEEILKKAANDRPQYAASLSWQPYSSLEIERRCQEVRLADLVLCPSEAVSASVMEAGARKENVRIVPFGIDLETFKPGTKARSGPFRALFVGQMTQRKGLGYLLEAWREASIENAELLIAGELPTNFDWRPHLTRDVRLLGKLSRPALVEMYQGCHCLVLPTLLEGQCNAVLEAMACGLPVLTTASAGLGDKLVHGVNGFLLKADRPAEWVQVLRSLSSNPEKIAEMGAAAFATSRAFSLQAYGARLIEAIEAVGGSR